MSSEENRDFDADKTACISLFKKEICNFGLIHHFFEENSIYWVDDIDHVCSMVIKTLKSLNKDGENQKIILPLWKEDEKQFAKDLFMLTLSNKEKYDSMLTSYTKNWEQDRLAKMDMILMNMAINEASEFSSIPVKVTLNEYIEISKFYSTPKSNGFINGILDNVFADLKKSGKITKTGRGLIN
jgi:N utilization substance protein B